MYVFALHGPFRTGFLDVLHNSDMALYSALCRVSPAKAKADVPLRGDAGLEPSDPVLLWIRLATPRLARCPLTPELPSPDPPPSACRCRWVFFSIVAFFARVFRKRLSLDTARVSSPIGSSGSV